MKPKRVLVVTAQGLVPPVTASENKELHLAPWKMEFDVMQALQTQGHETQIIEVSDDLLHIRSSIDEFKPHVVFNLVHEFHGVGVYDHHIAAYLELLKQPYTGCNPRGLMLAHDKVIAKKIMSYHDIPTPGFEVYRRRKPFKKPNGLQYPMIVKSTIEDASWGISQASIVNDEQKLKARVEYVHNETKSDALVEEYIEGREIYLGVMGNRRLKAFPPREIVFDGLAKNNYAIASHKAKWDEQYRERHKIRSERAKDFDEATEEQLLKAAKEIYRALHLSGYARLDCRLRDDGTLFFLEANPNCDLSFDDDFACAAEAMGLSFGDLIDRIVKLGRNYQPAWKRTD